jgi:nucleotide-binding universal stress UspA family protein
MQQEATIEMGKLRRAILADGYEVDTKIAVGSPVQQVEEYVASDNIDLIVTSTHGRSGVSRLLIGSTAERLVRYASCSVLVVPNRETCC